MNANHSLLCFWEGEKGFLCLEEVLVDFYEPLALRFCLLFCSNMAEVLASISETIYSIMRVDYS